MDSPADTKVEKEKPNFGLSGKLTEETNTYKGIVIKYSEPPEARKPQKIRWRLYPFKGEESLPVMHIHRQSAYLLGRERKIADIPIDHPSCSKQHAAIQYRLMPYERPNGTRGRRIRPYVIDLNSANGTFVNGKQIEASRYVELLEKDILKFGFSSREYVILHDESKDVEDDSEDESDPVPKLALPDQPHTQPKTIKQEQSSTTNTTQIETERSDSANRDISLLKSEQVESHDRGNVSSRLNTTNSDDSHDRDRISRHGSSRINSERTDSRGSSRFDSTRMKRERSQSEPRDRGRYNSSRLQHRADSRDREPRRRNERFSHDKRNRRSRR